MTHLHLENWRNFREVDVDLQARTFLVGPNASGKSNLLDSLRFLHDIVTGGGLRRAVKARGGIASLRSYHASESADVEVRVNLGTDEEPRLWDYKLRFNEDAQGQPKVKEETVQHDGGTLLNRPASRDEEDPELLTQTHLEQVNVNREFRDVARFVEQIRYLHLVPELVRDSERSTPEKNDPYGGDFLQRIASTEDEVRTARLRRIREALRAAVPDLAELVLDHDEPTSTPHLRGRFARGDDEGAWLTETHFSAGTLRLIGFLWAVQDEEGPLLLEEPGLSLHPEIVRAIPQMLARIQRGGDRQILMSTHSTELLEDDGIGLDEVLLLVPTDGGTSVQPANTVEEAGVLLEHGSSVADIAVAKTRPEDATLLSLLDWED